MFATLRRLYATLPDAASVARTASTPKAVRIRRAEQGLDVEPLESDATPEGLTPSEFARYQRALAKGELLQDDGSNLTEAQWLERLDSRRSRVRGVRQVVKDGEKETEVVGQKIYLPNIIFKMSVTKTDIRSYLLAVYGVQTTYIRTDNYQSPLMKMHGKPAFTTSDRRYKRAVVGLVEPFYYPQALEDMPREEREARTKWMKEQLLVGKVLTDRKLFFLRETRGSKGKEREQAIEEVKARIREDRAKTPTEAT
ncbi:hypothetical protein ONZ51_g8083 [Trametes cubensis]|uniref:Large ribosomal subunit protein uL23m n=1 Tax=Trametes cubensis TaxID=1111947 RepID=A0AAD7TRI2_9APHY|nr:hypothetical protein ONZ51_g8083 [Trametes cubensis]